MEEKMGARERVKIRIVSDADDDVVVPDGGSVRVPLYLQDAVRFSDDGEPRFMRAADAEVADAMAGHRPGYATLSAEQIAARRAGRRAMIDRATSAWDARRKPPPDPDEDDDDAPDAPWVPDARKGRAEYVRRLTDAWRHPVDAAQPDQSTSPDDPALMMRKHLRGNEDDDVVAIKEKAYSDYAANLANAWKNPPGVAPAAPAILGIGPANKVVERPTRGRTDPDAAGSIEKLRQRTLGR
jgi:hypothetical protein